MAALTSLINSICFESRDLGAGVRRGGLGLAEGKFFLHVPLFIYLKMRVCLI